MLFRSVLFGYAAPKIIQKFSRLLTTLLTYWIILIVLQSTKD